VHREAWGVLWAYGLLETTIEDNIRTRAGSAFSQAAAMSAVLDLASIPHFGLDVQQTDEDIPDQVWLLAGQGRHQYNLGIWRELPGMLAGMSRIPLRVNGYAMRGHTARIDERVFCSNVDELTINEDLTRIASLMPRSSLLLTPPAGQSMSLQEFLRDLASDHYQARRVVWPSAP
jgi:hypothetical protein